jgi:hypothetical protein
MSPPKSTEPQFTIHDAPPEPIKDGDDIDQIMHEVGKELKKDDHKPARHNFFSKKQPVDQHKPVPAQLPPHPAAANHAPPAAPAQPKPKTKSSAPVLVITLTVVVTGILIAAAVAAYK